MVRSAENEMARNAMTIMPASCVIAVSAARSGRNLDPMVVKEAQVKQ